MDGDEKIIQFQEDQEGHLIVLTDHGNLGVYSQATMKRNQGS